MARWYWYTRAFLRVGIITQPPTEKDFAFWMMFKKVPLDSRCRVCNKPFWTVGDAKVCDNYGCYVKDKMKERR